MRNANTNLIGLIAIVVGALLVMGALMFLLVTSLMSGLPRFLSIPAVLQIVLGSLAATAGFLYRRGHPRAKVILIAVAVCIVANIGLLFAIFVTRFA
jgi:hypothetical protein